MKQHGLFVLANALAGAAVALTGGDSRRLGQRYSRGHPLVGSSPPTGCHGGSCGGMAHYPVGDDIMYYSVFDVPEKPRKADGICYYIYFNIFFSGKGHGTMNQFVPQLMLGNSLTNSSGTCEPVSVACGVVECAIGVSRLGQFVLLLTWILTSGAPDYLPKWIQHDDWVFGSQYFFEINNTKTNNTHEGHAATGPFFPVSRDCARATSLSVAV